MKCDRCGVESENQEFFRVERRPFSSRTRAFCPSCFLAKDDAVLKTVFLSFIGMGLAGLVLILALPQYTFGALLLNMGIVLVAFLLGTIIHEAGHALAGAAVGVRIFHIDIGKGATIFEFKWARLRWRFRALLFGGLVQGYPRCRDRYRLKMSVFILGGPAANALAALIASRFLWVDKALDGASLAELKPIGIFLLSNCLLLAFSLWPYETNSHAGRIPNDLLSLWRTLRLSLSKVAEAGWCLHFLEAGECRREGNLVGARQWLAKGLDEYPGNETLRFYSATLSVYEEKLDGARDSLHGVLADLPKDSKLIPYVLNNIAFADAMLEKPELLSEADDFSMRVSEKMPWVASFKGTRGMVLVVMGRYDEGVALLQQALKLHTENEGKAISACCLGIAAKRRGFVSESDNYFSLARRFDPQCHLLAHASS